MTNTENWEGQQGGLYLAVKPFDKTNALHRDAATDVMRRTVQSVAQTHSAAFDEAGFSRNMHALYSGDIRVDFFLAKWDICNAKPIYLGAATNWPTVGIDQHGNIRRGVYTEDVCLLTDKLRQLIQAKPTGKEFPEESLLECFERISLKNMRANGEVYKFGEIDLDNTRAMRPQLNNGGVFGKAGDSAVLEFGAIPSLFDRGLIDLPAVHPQKNLFEDEKLFIVPWQGGDSDIRFIATKGRSTAAGRPRVDIRPWHNGVLPDQPTLELVVASALFAIKNEVENQSWSHQPLHMAASPSVPICGDVLQGYSALHNACGTEIILPASYRQPTFATPAPEAHVFIINDRPMLETFQALGAAPRLFGNKPMMPGVNVLTQKLF